MNHPTPCDTCGHADSHGAIAGCTAAVGGQFCDCRRYVPQARPEPTPDTITPGPGARTTDPGTSHKAAPAIHIKAGTQRTRLLAGFAALGEAGGTDEDAMDAADGVSPRSEYAKRCSELREAGFITWTGEERKGRAGTPRSCSRITDAGRRALAAANVAPGKPRQRKPNLTKAEASALSRAKGALRAAPAPTERVVLLTETVRDLVAAVERLA